MRTPRRAGARKLAAALLLVLLGSVRVVSAQAALDETALNVAEYDYVPKGYEVASDSGIQWIRVVAHWKWMEPSQGSIDFSELDQKVAAALDGGHKVLINFTSIPPWANGSSPNCDFWAGECSAPPTSAAFFPAFVSAVVNRYKSDVQAWEIWNEPDYFVFWDGTVQEWVDLIAVPGADAVHNADAAAVVLGPSTYWNLGGFQQHVSPICSHIDALSVHFYPESVASMFDLIDNSFQPWIAQHCNKPLWVTEMGIDSSVVGEAQQAAQYVAAFQGSAARSNLAKIFLFYWCDAVIDLQGTISYWGLVERQERGYRPKRTLFEIQDYVASLKGQPSYLVARDTFANSAGRPLGGALSGTATEVGAKSWGAVSTLVMGTSEVTTSVGGSQAHIGGIPFNPPADPTKPANSVEADLVVTGTDWIGLGFSLSATGGFWGHGQVWSHLNPDGTYAIYADGLSHLLKTGTIPRYVPGGLNHLLIRHNRAANTLSVVINRTIVLFELDLDALAVPFTPSLAFAGFHIQTSAGSAAGEASIDNVRIFSMPDTWIFFDSFESGNTTAWSDTCPPDCT